MRYDWDEHTLLIAHNFSAKPRAFSLDAEVVGGRQLINLLTREDCEADENGRLHLELDGYGYRWFRTGGIDRNVPVRKDACVTAHDCAATRSGVAPSPGAAWALRDPAWAAR